MKQRLTITLSDDLLKQVDAMIDKVTVRNRSHAIEHLIAQSIAPRLNTAVIMAGGDEAQREILLTEISGIPLLTHMITQCTKYGITHFVVCLTGISKLVESRYGDGTAYGVSIAYSYEPKVVGTAGALKAAQELLPAHSPILVMHGDILTSIDITDLFAFHQREGAIATIAVKPRLSKREYGQVFMQGNRVITFSQTGQESGISIINSGVYILEPEVLAMIKGSGKIMLEGDIFPHLSKKNGVHAFFFQGSWFDISDEHQLEQARERWPVE